MSDEIERRLPVGQHQLIRIFPPDEQAGQSVWDFHPGWSKLPIRVQRPLIVKILGISDLLPENRYKNRGQVTRPAPHRERHHS